MTTRTPFFPAIMVTCPPLWFLARVVRVFPRKEEHVVAAMAIVDAHVTTRPSPTPPSTPNPGGSLSPLPPSHSLCPSQSLSVPLTSHSLSHSLSQFLSPLTPSVPLPLSLNPSLTPSHSLSPSHTLPLSIPVNPSHLSPSLSHTPSLNPSQSLTPSHLFLSVPPSLTPSVTIIPTFSRHLGASMLVSLARSLARWVSVTLPSRQGSRCVHFSVCLGRWWMAWGMEWKRRMA